MGKNIEVNDIVEVHQIVKDGAFIRDNWIPAIVIYVGKSSFNVRALKGAFDDEGRNLTTLPFHRNPGKSKQWR